MEISIIFIELIYSNLTDFTDFKKPCERKEKYTFAHVCKICINAKFAYTKIMVMCSGFKKAKTVEKSA